MSLQIRTTFPDKWPIDKVWLGQRPWLCDVGVWLVMMTVLVSRLAPKLSN